MAQNDDLLRPVGGGHPDPVLPPDLVGRPLDVGVRRLRLLGIDNGDVVVLFYAAQTALHLVGVKHQDDPAFPVALIVAQEVAQLFPGGVQMFRRQLFQLVPRENDIIPVYQQIILAGEGLFQFPPFFLRIIGHRPLRSLGWKKTLPLHRAVGPLEDGLQFLILGCGPCVGTDGPPLGGRFLRFRLRPLRAPAAVHLGVLGHLPPRDHHTGPVGAEHGIRRVFHVPFRVVPHGLDDGFRLRAGEIPRRDAGQPPLSTGVDRHLPGVIPKARHRGRAGEGRFLSHGLRRVHLAAHLLQVRHGPAHLLGGDLQPEPVPRLQQHAFRLHQPLPHGPVGGLSEIAALGVLFVGAARQQGDFDIGDG